MAHSLEFSAVIEEFKNDAKKHSFAELIARVWGGKLVEVYIGDTYEDLKFEDSTQKCPAVLIGKMMDAYGECLVLDCAYVEQGTKVVKFGNIVCLNERSIRTITEVDGSGMLRDTFLNSKDGKVVKSALKGPRE